MPTPKAALAATATYRIIFAKPPVLKHALFSSAAILRQQRLLAGFDGGIAGLHAVTFFAYRGWLLVAVMAEALNNGCTFDFLSQDRVLLALLAQLKTVDLRQSRSKTKVQKLETA